MTAKIIAIAIGIVVAIGGVATAIGDIGSDDPEEQIAQVDLRKDDLGNDVELVDEDDDDRDRDKDTGDRTGGPGDTGQNPATGSGDRTGGTHRTAGTGYSGDTGDGDATGGNDGTGGGDNSYVAPVSDDGYAAPAPAPAPAYGDDASYSGGGSDG
jgi:hypothetical protein